MNFLGTGPVQSNYIARCDSTSSFNLTTYVKNFKKKCNDHMITEAEMMDGINNDNKTIDEFDAANHSLDIYVHVIYDLLMRSQLSVVANSSKVRLICLPSNCLNYLSEPVRKEIRQKILSLYIPIPDKKPPQNDTKQK